MKDMNRYILKEHLVLGKDARNCPAVSLLKNRLLAFSMSLMPRGCVRRCELALRTGKKLHAFVGKLPTPEFYGIVSALEQGEDLEFIGFYEYDWEAWWEQSQGADPFSLQSFFLRAGQTEGIFYASYAADDTEPGEIFAFGEKNGRQYRGVVPFVPLQALPETGRWFAPKAAVLFTQDQLQKVNIHALLPVCRRLCNLGGEPELYFAGHCFHLSLRRLEMHRAPELQKYLSLCHALQQVTAGNCQAYEELVDLSAADPRMLIVSPLPDGGAELKITVL